MTPYSLETESLPRKGSVRQYDPGSGRNTQLVCGKEWAGHLSELQLITERSLEEVVLLQAVSEDGIPKIQANEGLSIWAYSLKDSRY